MQIHSKFIPKITLVLTITSMLLLACNNTGPAPSSNSETSKSESRPDLVFLATGDSASTMVGKSDRILEEINKRVGINLIVKNVPQGGFEKINVAMASGDFPDVLTINFPSASLLQWQKEGIVIPLDPYLKDMPTVKSKIEKNLTWTKVDGKYYGFPFVIPNAGWSMNYREDWMTKLGIKPPQTLDEFYQALVAIKTKDPDGNGKNDTIGLSSMKPASNHLGFAFYAYGMPYADWILNDQGKVSPRFEHPSFKQGLEYLNKLYKEGLLDPEFMVNKAEQMENKFFQERVGFMTNTLFRHVTRIETSLQKVNPNGKLGFMDPPAGPNGKKGMSAAPKGGLFTAITKGSKNPEKAAKFIEFMVSKEGRELLQLGIEGIHYTKKDGKTVYNEEERKKDGFASGGWSHPLAWGTVAWPQSEVYLPETEPNSKRALESVEVATRNMMPNLVGTVGPIEQELGGVVNEIYEQYFTDMVIGKIDIDRGLQELKSKWTSQGGDKILAEVTASYNLQKK
jgi:putative aldouronate transport system substrate-binding protein